MRLETNGFDNVDQAARLRDLARGGALCPATVAITSGKGGVGKTNLSVNLAICLAARRLRVTLLDADFGLANADVLLNLRSRLNLAHVLCGQCELQDVLLSAPGGFSLVPASTGLARMANLSSFERHRLISMLAELERTTDVLLIDCGAGISRNVTAFAGAADLCLVVTTPEPTAVTDAYAMTKVLAQTAVEPRVGLVVNQCCSKPEVRRTHERVASVAAKFLNLALRDFGYILADEHVGQAIRQRMPLTLRYPRSSASACVRAIAGRLADDVAVREAREGFLKRVASMFF